MNLSNITAGATVALALSDGTPVELVKITSKDNIQVRVPSDHDELGSDPLRIFRRDGSHYKNATDLKLVIKEAAADGAPAPAAAPVSLTKTAAAPVSNVSPTHYEVDGQTFSTLADAKAEAIDLFRDTGDTIEIFAVVRSVAGKVGFVAA